VHEERNSSVHLEDILSALLRRRRAVLSVVVTGVAVSALLALLEKPTYQANAKLMVTSERARLTVSPDPNSGSTVERVTDQDLNSEVALLQSPGLLREVLQPQRARIERESDLDPARRLYRAAMAPLRSLTQRHDNTPEPSPFDEWMASVGHRLAIEAIKGSNLIEVSFDGSDPNWVAALVNDLIQRHVDRHARINQQSAALEFLGQQRQLLAEKVRQAEIALTAFYRREGVDAVSTQRSSLRTRVADLESSLAQGEIELAEAVAGGSETLRFASPTTTRGEGSTSASTTTSQDPLQVIRTRITELQLQRADLASRLAPTSLKLQMFDQQIADAQRLLKKEAKQTSQERVTAAKARTGALHTQIEAYRVKLHHLDQIAPEGERLEQELASERESFLTYSKKVEEARFSNALDQSRIVNVGIVERAEVPSIPRPSRKSLTLLLGAIMSLAAGLGLALLLDRVDPAVETAAAAERITGFKVLAEIPL
jgi:uncharacterized protein involved in exopolysaccharide biosynthesis